MLPATFPTSPLYEWYFSFRTLAKQLQVMHDTLHPFVIDMEAAVHQLVTNAPNTISLLIFLEYVTDCFRN